MRNKCECVPDVRNHQQAYDEGLAAGKQAATNENQARWTRENAMRLAVDSKIGDPISMAYRVEQFLNGETATIPSAKS